MDRILFIYTSKASFVRQDLEFLKTKYQVSELPFDNRGTPRLLLSLCKQLFLLPFLLCRHRMVYIWFGDYHSFLPVFFARLLRRSSLLVIGGYDVVRNPHLNYGSFKNKIRSACTIYSIRNATVNLCVSKHILRKLKAIAPKANSKLVYNGVPLRDVPAVPKNQKKIICVASLTTPQKLAIKGIDRLIDLARLTPGFDYWIVGMFPKAYPNLIAALPFNVHTVEFLPQEELTKHLADAQFYIQLSREESFCLAMAEAMLCDCIPIYTCTGGLPEVAGPCGKGIHPYSSEQVAYTLINWGGIGDAPSPIGDAPSPSDWIKSQFLVEQRNLALSKIIDPILH